MKPICKIDNQTYAKAKHTPHTRTKSFRSKLPPSETNSSLTHFEMLSGNHTYFIRGPRHITCPILRHMGTRLCVLVVPVAPTGTVCILLEADGVEPCRTNGLMAEEIDGRKKQTVEVPFRFSVTIFHIVQCYGPTKQSADKIIRLCESDSTDMCTIYTPMYVLYISTENFARRFHFFLRRWQRS